MTLEAGTLHYIQMIVLQRIHDSVWEKGKEITIEMISFELKLFEKMTNFHDIYLFSYRV